MTWKNRYSTSLLCLCLAGAQLCGCSESEPEEAHGTLALAGGGVACSLTEHVVSRIVSVADFAVEIVDAAGQTVKSFTWSERPESLELPADNYRFVAASPGEEPAVAWDAPYYYGEKSFEILPLQQTELGTVTCTLHGVKVTVSYSSGLLALVSGEYRTTVTLGDASAVFADGDGRAAYLRAGASSLEVRFEGTVEDEPLVMERSWSDAAGGDWWQINFGLVPSTAASAGRAGVEAKAEIKVRDYEN